MRLILLVCLLIVGCAAQTYKQQELQTYIKEQGEIRLAEKITAVEFANRIDAKRVELFGHDPLDDEFYAFLHLIARQRDDGKVTREEGAYLITQKRNEILERAANANYRQQQLSLQQGALGLGLIQAGAPRTNNINCQSYRTGTIVNTNCQ